MILLGILLVPVVVGVPLLLLALMIDEESFFPFDKWYDPALALLLGTTWLLLVGIYLWDKRKNGNKKLAHIRETVELHYENEWFE